MGQATIRITLAGNNWGDINKYQAGEGLLSKVLYKKGRYAYMNNDLECFYPPTTFRYDADKSMLFFQLPSCLFFVYPES